MLFLARNLGYFNQQPIKLIEMPSSTETAMAFRNGSLDVAGLTLDESLTLLQSVPSLTVILVLDVSMGADVLLVKPEIDSLEHLRGKRIGVENTAVGAVLLQGALQAANLTVADVDLRSVTFDRHESAFIKNQVDAIVTFEPVKSKLTALGARLLYDSSRIPGRIVDVLVTRREVIEQHPELLQTIIAGHFLALTYWHEHSADAAARIAPNMAVQPEQVVEYFEGVELPNLATVQRWLSGDTPALNKSIAMLSSVMLKNGLLFKPIDASGLIDASLLPVNNEE